MRCMGRNDKKVSRTRLSVIQDSLSSSCRRKSANPGSLGKETTRYHRASWQGGWALCTVSFSRWPKRRGRPFGHIATQKEGKSLTWRWSPRVLFGPQGPCRRLQRKRRERSVRSFGP